MKVDEKKPCSRQWYAKSVAVTKPATPSDSPADKVCKKRLTMKVQLVYTPTKRSVQAYHEARSTKGRSSISPQRLPRPLREHEHLRAKTGANKPLHSKSTEVQRTDAESVAMVEAQVYGALHRRNTRFALANKQDTFFTAARLARRC